MKKIYVTAAAIVFCVLVFSCKTTETTAQTAPANNVVVESGVGLTPEQEYFLGRAASASILSTYRIWEGNRQLTNYLNLICNAIAINSPYPNLYNGYRAAILDSNEVNAFSTSGGHIFLTRGLVDAIKSEDALAAVLAHEIAHIQLRHTIPQVLQETEAPDMNTFIELFDQAVAETVNALAKDGYSLNQEFEADNLALSLMASAGYNPKSYIDMLHNLNTAQNRARGGFNNTHPTPSVRADNAEVSIERHEIPDTRVHRQIRFVAAGIR